MWAYVCPAGGFMLVSEKQYLPVTCTDSPSPGTHFFCRPSVSWSFVYSFVRLFFPSVSFFSQYVS